MTNSIPALVPPSVIEWRKRTGMYQRDEMWDGVLHMSPEADREHQDIEWSLETYLRLRWARPRRAKVYHRINISRVGAGSDWINNYRIPDLVLLTSERFHIDHRTHFEGGPNVVVEIRSPYDESEEKFPFYAEVNVPEVWIIDRDTKEPEVHVLYGSEYRLQSPTPEGWCRSPFSGIEMRAGRRGKLLIRINGDDSTCEELPED